MRKQDKRGFTLIEVVLAIAVGLIIIAGVSIGYSYAKRAAILDNQRKNVAAIKTFVEQAVAATQANLASVGGVLNPPAISQPQLAQLAGGLSSLKIDPYNGTDRTTMPACTVSGGFSGLNIIAASCIGTGIARWQDNIYVSNAGTRGVGSAVVYLAVIPNAAIPISGFTQPLTVTLVDGTTKTLYGYAIVETDADGNIIAAEGGSQTNS